jgi:hypothetical protein
MVALLNLIMPLAILLSLVVYHFHTLNATAIALIARIGYTAINATTFAIRPNPAVV